MNNSDLAEGDIVKNRSSGELLKITNVGARHIKVVKLDGMFAEYQREFLIPASEEDINNTKDKFPKPSLRLHGPAVKTADVQETIAMFSSYSEELKAKYPKSHPAFLEFWADLLSIAGNHPGGSWAMRKAGSKHNCPVLKTYNTKTGRWNQFFYVLWWNKVRLEIAKGYLPPEFEPLFPEKATMYGTCHAVEMALPEFQSKKQDYLNCLKEVYRRYPNPSGF